MQKGTWKQHSEFLGFCLLERCVVGGDVCIHCRGFGQRAPLTFLQILIHPKLHLTVSSLVFLVVSAPSRVMIPNRASRCLKRWEEVRCPWRGRHSGVEAPPLMMGREENCPQSLALRRKDVGSGKRWLPGEFGHLRCFVVSCEPII